MRVPFQFRPHLGGEKADKMRSFVGSVLGKLDLMRDAANNAISKELRWIHILTYSVYIQSHEMDSEDALLFSPP